MSGLRNPFAVRDGKIILIEDLAINERGLNCKCSCPACDGDFIARMGEINIHHFAHSKDSCDEVLAYTSGLYRMIHQVLGSGNPFYVPALIVAYTLPKHGFLSEKNISSYVRIVGEDYYTKDKIIVSSGRQVVFESAEIVYDSKNNIQAIILMYKKSTMAIKVMPPDTICKAGAAPTPYKDMSTLVLDFTDDTNLIQESSSESFQKHLLSDKLEKRWVYNSKAKKAYPVIIEKSKIAFQEHLKRKKKLEEERKAIAEQAAAQRVKHESQHNEKMAAEQNETFERIRDEVIIKLDYKEYADKFNQQTEPVYDRAGYRLMKCEICGEIKRAGAFFRLGVGSQLNFGRCKECSSTQSRLF